MINDVKTDKDLHTDIEMAKVGAQEKQASAFEKIAINLRNTPSDDSHPQKVTAPRLYSRTKRTQRTARQRRYNAARV